MEFIDLKTQYQKYKVEIDRQIQEVLDTSQYILGPKVKELEEKLANYVGVKHCITASSGTDTLLMALMALGIGPGDEVITTPFTWISTVEMIVFLGAKPVYVDLDIKTQNLDVDQIEEKITRNTKAIMPVSLFGQMPDYDKINEIANKYHLPVIEDGAQSFGATQNGRKSCGMTTIGSTSFFPAKPLGCYGDGGALFTDDDAIAQKLRAIRVHGGEMRNHHTMLGINGRFDAVQAAVLLAKLPHFEDEINARIRLGRRYTELLEGVVKTPLVEKGNTSLYAMYTIRHPERDRIQAYLKEKGIPSGIYYPKAAFEQPAYQSDDADISHFPKTQEACREVLSLPMHPWLTDEEQKFVADAIKEALTLAHAGV